MQIPTVKVDTTELDQATLKVQKLILDIEKLYELIDKCWLLQFIFRVKK